MSVFLVVLPGTVVFAQPPLEPALLSANRVSTAEASKMTTLQLSEPRIFAAVADRAFGLAMKSAVLPALFGDDSHYVASPSASGIRRVGYAAAHTVMTQSNDGRRHFNATAIGGAGITAGLSNLYHPAADRTIGATLSRWGTQVLVDALSNELKEFGPELRRLFRRQ